MGDGNKICESKRRKIAVTKRHIQRLASSECNRIAETIRIKEEFVNNQRSLSHEQTLNIEFTAQDATQEIVKDEMCHLNAVVDSQFSAASSFHLLEDNVTRIVDANHSIDQNENSETDDALNDQFKKFVSHWAVFTNTSHVACNLLLEGLRKFTSCDFPKDIRTLIKTPRASHVIPMGEGNYCHFGLGQVLQQMIIDLRTMHCKRINLLVNIDGLPLSKSSRACLWPILCSNTESKNVYIVGAYFGETKPANAELFLRQFINELKQFVAHGFFLENDFTEIRLHAIICDAPAKSFVLCTKSHVAFYGCPKCTIEGVYLKNRTCFPSSESSTITLRTDANFRNLVYEDHQKGQSILVEVPEFDLIENIPLDYMHLVCLGVVKKLIHLWLDAGPISVRLRSIHVERISAKLREMKKKTPDDFGRRPRSLIEYRQWKAIEFRSFLLYTGPVVLKDYLEAYIYNHFISLHVAISILTSPKMSTKDECIQYAQNLLIHFVYSFEIIYGKHFVSYNIHNLLHLVDDVKKYGPLDIFSAFRFENYLSSIKTLLRKSEKPLQQLWNRYTESRLNVRADEAVRKKKIICSKEHFSGPVVPFLKITAQYRHLYNGIYNIRCDRESDSICILTDGSCIRINNIVKTENDGIFILGKLLCPLEDCFYSVPCSSKELNIQFVSKRSLKLGCWPLNDVLTKAWGIPYKDSWTIFPILHTVV